MASSSSSSRSKNIASQTTKQWNTYKANKNFRNQLKRAEKNQPIYQDAYKGYKDAIANQLENGGFEFDAANNNVYQGYVNDYRLLGNIAADASQANIEDLSGGYGTTYSGTVAQQGLEGYLANEKNILPALYQQERANYQQDYANTINKGNLYNQLEGQAFEQYQNKLARWNTNREYAYNKFYNDYLQSAKEHKKVKGKEQTWETTNTTSVASSGGGGGGRRRSGKKGSLPVSAIKDKKAAKQYLIAQGYGDQLDDLMGRQRYITERARQDRDYNAGYTGLSKDDPDYAYKKSVEDKVDVDYSGYLYNYIRNKLRSNK